MMALWLVAVLFYQGMWMILTYYCRIWRSTIIINILVSSMYKNNKDHLEDFEKMIEEIKRLLGRYEFNYQHNLLTISLTDELVQELVHEDILLDKEPMDQKFEEEPSFPKEVETSPQEAKECVLPMILTSSQPTPNLHKIHLLPFAFSTLSYGEVLYFVDYKDTWPIILFKLTYFMAGSPRVVDYATLHGRTPYFEDTRSLAIDF